MTKNIAANYMGRAWAVISVFLFVPIYLKFLGIEAFGLVGFYSTLMSVLAFADIGLTATLNREMARLSAGEDSAEDKCDLLRTYELAYACISLLLALLIWFLAPLIANQWLQFAMLDPRDITFALRLMGLSIALQLPTNLYIGGLMGLQKQVLSNFIQIGWGILRGVGSIFVLWLLSPTILAFFSWQLFCSVVYCFFARLSIWRAVSPGAFRPQFKWLVFQNTWRYALGMAGVAFLSTLLMQGDKLAVSKMLPLETFGYYTLAVTLAGVPMMLRSPIGAAVFPRLTNLVAADDRNGLVGLYHRSAALVAVAVIPGGLTLAFFSGDFILAWTGNIFAAEQVGLAAAFLIGGELLQTVRVIPYYVSLAYGNVKLNLQIGIAQVVLLIPLLIVLIMKYGVVGAGLSWLIVNICTLPPYIYVLHRRFLPGELRRWCLWSVGRPLLVALSLVLLGRWFVPHTSSRLLTLFLIGLVWAVATVATANTVPEIRTFLVKKSNQFLRGSNGIQE